MPACDPADGEVPWLVLRARGKLDSARVIPHGLCITEVDAVFGFVGMALRVVTLEPHEQTPPLILRRNYTITERASIARDADGRG